MNKKTLTGIVLSFSLGAAGTYFGMQHYNSLTQFKCVMTKNTAIAEATGDMNGKNAINDATQYVVSGYCNYDVFKHLQSTQYSLKPEGDEL